MSAWSAWVDDPDAPVPDGVLDLRADAPLPGFAPLADGADEFVRPVPQQLPDVEATRDLGRRVAGALRAGDLLVLSGPLGAGKTTFTQGLGEALGVRGSITSPTFVLARVHRAGRPGSLPLLHVDAYRLRDQPGPLHLDDLGLEAALEDAVTVVEWGEGVVEHLTDDRLEVSLDRTGETRTATVRAHGLRWTARSRPV